MKRALAIVAGAVMVCAAAYFSWLNRTPVEVHFAPGYQVAADVGTLLIFAFVAGALLILAAVALQTGRRTFSGWRVGRRQRRNERIDDWEEQGERLVWDGNIRQGRALLQRAWQRRPGNAYPILALAASYRDAAQIQRARELLTTAAAQHHTNPDVLLALAEAHGAAGDHTAKVHVLERLRALHPRAPRVLRALRDAYVEAQRWKDAATLQEALLAELRDSKDDALPERDYLNILRYQAGVSQSEPSARLQVLETLTDSRLGPVPIAVSLGDALLGTGRAGDASVLWERALRSTPRTVLVERLAGIATEERHRDRLRSLLTKLRADQVDADNLRLITAQLFLADGNADQAARQLEALRSPGTAPVATNRLWAEIHRRHGHLEQAINAYTRTDGSWHAYHCTRCERSTSEWTGYCPQCGRWDSYRAAVEIGVP